MKKYELFGLIVLFTTMMASLLSIFIATNHEAVMNATVLFLIVGMITSIALIYLDRKYK
jgi:uncharacterized membrane protein